MTQLIPHTQKINERKKNQYFEHQSTNVEKKMLKTSVTDGRIFFKDKLFIPEVGQLKLRCIKKIHDDPAARHPNKTKTYEILNRCYYWPKVINDVKLFVRNCYGCKKNKKFRDKYHGDLKFLPVPNKLWFHISIDFIVDLPINCNVPML